MLAKLIDCLVSEGPWGSDEAVTPGSPIQSSPVSREGRKKKTPQAPTDQPTQKSAARPLWLREGKKSSRMRSPGR